MKLRGKPGILLAATVLLALAGAPNASAAKLQLVQDSTLQMSSPNESPRAVALCPGAKEPYGGGMYASLPPDADGEGVYPHSYERLGAQSGFHTTPVLFDPTPRTGARTYQVTLQTLCGTKFGKVSDPHDIALNVPAGTSLTLNANCVGKTVLIGGGFQRMAFEAGGGVYPQESRMISKTGWQATGVAFGTIKNDAVSIAYCMGSPGKKQLLTEVAATVAIPPRTVGFATTPPCTGGRSLISNGFDLNPKSTGPAQEAMLFADGIMNANQTFTGSAYNGTQVTGTLTAYGYCIKNKVIGGSLKKFAKKHGDATEKTKPDQDGNPNG